MLWDKERERIKKKEKEKEIAAKMAVRYYLFEKEWFSCWKAINYLTKQISILLFAIFKIPSGAGKKLTDEDLIGKSQDEIDMMRVMGFGSFDSTKNKKVGLMLEKLVTLV